MSRSSRAPVARAGYLVYLGVQGIRHRRSLRSALNQAAEPKSIARIVRDGIVVGVSNPKAIVFFAAVLPQFVDRQAGDVPAQMLPPGAAEPADGVVAHAAGQVGGVATLAH